jgi:hypothetical protein
MELPHLTPLPDAVDAECLCPRCLDEVRMLTNPETVRVQIRQLYAALKEAARPEPPPDAKPGEWLLGYVDYTEHPGDYWSATGPQMWTPRRLSLARVLLMRDLGKSH